MGRSLLTEVNFTELVNNQSRSYTMSYNDYVDDYSPTQTKAVDKFGYYNGRTGNTDLVERQLVEFGMPYDGDRGVCYAYIGGADRTPDILFAQVYSLPDTDEYGNAISSYAGGLRIYSIQCRDVEGTLKNERRFLYEKDGIPTGYAPQVTFVDEMEKLYLRTYSRTSMRYRLYSSLPVADAGAAAGVSVLYPNVSVVEKDDYGKTVSREDYEYNTNFYFPSIINGMVHDEVSHYKKGKLVRRTDYDVDTEQPVHDEEHTYTEISLNNNTPVVAGREVRRANLVVAEQSGVETDDDLYYREYRYSIGRGNTRVENQLTVNTDYYAGKLVSDTVVRTYGSTDWDIRSGLSVREIYKYSDGKKRNVIILIHIMLMMPLEGR